MLKHSEKIILILIRKALNCKYRTDLSRFQNMDWNEVMDIASIQGVLGVCLDGLTSILSILPDDQNIGLSLDQKMEWMVKSH